MSWLGLDVGGANLKMADGRGWARTVPFPLWREPDGLAAALLAMLATAPPAERLAVTMTGELCDCFRDKMEGVRHILEAVEQAAGPREVFVYLVDGRIVPADHARDVANLAAASNWHALARFACRFLNGLAGLLIDVGSTTTDIVPLGNRQPQPSAWNDTDRLMCGELVYTGVGRTPVCAITPWLPWRGRRCPVAAELFATAADAYVILGQIAENPHATWTADGRGLTHEFARDRLARMICIDSTQFDAQDAHCAAETVRDAQFDQLRAALARVVGRMQQRPNNAILSGSGEFLAAPLVQAELGRAEVTSLASTWGPAVSTAGPAHALAVLAGELPFQGGKC